MLAVLILAASVVLAIDVRRAHAHGEHGDAQPPEGGVSLVSFEEFQAELLTSPRPPRAGAETRVVIKILHRDSHAPVRDGLVLMGVAPSANGRDPAEDTMALLPVEEMTWAGNYTLVQKFAGPGMHVVRVSIARIGARSYDPPKLLEFRLNVAPPPGFNAGLLALFLTASLIAVAGMYWGVLRTRSGSGSNKPFNLLSLPWLNRLVIWKGFQPVLQIPVLLLTAAIVWIGLFDVQDGAQNLATKLTWILWWPGIVFTFILVGRLWCVACPFGVVNEAVAKWIKTPRMFPKALRGLWIATLLFVLLTWADEQLGIIRSPRMTAWLIVFLALAAAVTALFYQRRSFCRYLCPITGLQALYSMISPVEIRATEREFCGKECRQNCYRGSEAAAGCPMLEFPMTLDRNANCNFCFECVKACPQGNLMLRFRSFGKDLWSSARRSLDESYLALVLVGLTTIVTAQMLSAWGGWISSLSRMVPVELRTLVKPVTYLTLTETALFFLIALLFVPLLGYGAAWMADRISGGPGRGARGFLIVLGYMFIPVGLAMHLAHNLSHLLLEGAGVIPAMQRMVAGSASEINWQRAPLVDADIVYGMQMTLILIGLVFSIVVGTRLARNFLSDGVNSGKALVPFIALALLFTLINLYMLNQPMGMRHGM